MLCRIADQAEWSPPSIQMVFRILVRGRWMIPKCCTMLQDLERPDLPRIIHNNQTRGGRAFFTRRRRTHYLWPC